MSWSPVEAISNFRAVVLSTVNFYGNFRNMGQVFVRNSAKKSFQPMDVRKARWAPRPIAKNEFILRVEDCGCFGIDLFVQTKEHGERCGRELLVDGMFPKWGTDVDRLIFDKEQFVDSISYLQQIKELLIAHSAGRI